MRFVFLAFQFCRIRRDKCGLLIVCFYFEGVFFVLSVDLFVRCYR